MATTELAPGTPVHVRTAFDGELERVALTGVVMGSDFQVVWVCRPEEWVNADREHRTPEGVPWPAEDVRVGA
jgi:hypothetical protein